MLNGCALDQISKKEIVSEYYNARSEYNFKEIKELINDSLTVIDGDYKMEYSKESYYEVFKWDSIFQTTYDQIELQELDQQIIASVSLSSIRNRFLDNNEMTCKFKISFHSEKISKIESLDCKNADWEKWQKGVQSLVEWIEINHPELNGFIHDMTMNGAINYLKAIELYERKEKEL